MRALVVLVFASLGSAACDGSAEDSAPQARREVVARLEAYTAAARAVDADASVAFFTDGGTLFEPGITPLVSRDSIRAFIRSFPGVVVDSAAATADTVQVFGRTAIVWGSFFERLRFPGQPESAQHGRFVMEWQRGADGTWRIHRYYRVPLPQGWQPGPATP